MLTDSFSPLLFAGKTALVTGGTSGIGLATAEALSVLGARVLAAGLGAGTVKSQSAVEPIELDVLDVEACERLVGGLDRLDILVNGAGIGTRFTEHEAPVFERTIAINLTAPLRISGLVRPLMARTGGGSIVNLSSMYATFGNADAPGYASSKGGIDQLTRSLAIAYAGDKIRVNAVAPGWINTPMLAPLAAEPEIANAILARTPAARFGEPAEIAAVIAFLCSPAAGFVNGATVPIDGGYLCT